MAVRYRLPESWLKYDIQGVAPELTEAKAAVLSLTAIPFQRSWADKLQEIELKREVAGTSKIEGADFTDNEFEEAIADDSPEDRMTRSQRQARAAINTYRWIGALPTDRPIDDRLIREIHIRIVTGCDDDHCAPGQLRGAGQNVIFGRPRHRGVEGGLECEKAFRALLEAVNGVFRAHDPMIQALAVHYHIGAMHPFQDGNGRTARALEALLLKRASLRDSLFVSMSNYYYDEKDSYLDCLSESRKSNHNLTPFLKFALRGIASQCHRLLREIRRHVEKSLFRDVMGQMYGRLRSTRKRALADRQLAILQRLLEKDERINYLELFDLLYRHYSSLKAPGKAFVRDLNHLGGLGAIRIEKEGEDFWLTVRLEWATEITRDRILQGNQQAPESKNPHHSCLNRPGQGL